MLVYTPRPTHIEAELLAKGHQHAKSDLLNLAAGPADASYGFLALKLWYGAKTIYGVKLGAYSKVAASVDWAAWRLEFEYADLLRRSDRMAASASNFVEAGVILERSLALCLMQRHDEAKAYLRKWGGGIEKTIARMNLAKDRPQIGAGDLAAIGLLYDRLLNWMPDHPAFGYDHTLLTAEGRARILDARKIYAKSRSEGGYLLGGFAHERIPLDLIYVNQCTAEAERDEGLSALAVAISSTKYPDDTLLKSYDKALTDIGY